MQFLVYDAISGKEISRGPKIGDDVRADPRFGVFEIDKFPDDVTHEWSPSQRMFVPRTGATRSVISTADYLERLGDACLVSVQVAAYGATAPAATLRAWLMRLQAASEVDVSSARIVADVDWLIFDKHLSPDRRAIVLAPVVLP